MVQSVGVRRPGGEGRPAGVDGTNRGTSCFGRCELGCDERTVSAVLRIPNGREVDADVEATVLFGAIRGTIAQWLFEPKTIDMKQVAVSLVENTRRSLGVDSYTPHTNGRIRSTRIRRG